MPHEFTHEQLDEKVYDSLERRRLRRQQMQQGGAAGDQGLTEKLRAAMARRRQAQPGIQKEPLG